MFVIQLLAKMRLTVSMSQGRRAIVQGVVKLNDQPVDLETEIEPKVGDKVVFGRSTFTVSQEDLERE